MAIEIETLQQNAPCRLTTQVPFRMGMAPMHAAGIGFKMRS